QMRRAADEDLSPLREALRLHEAQVGTIEREGPGRRRDQERGDVAGERSQELRTQGAVGKERLLPDLVVAPVVVSAAHLPQPVGVLALAVCAARLGMPRKPRSPQWYQPSWKAGAGTFRAKLNVLSVVAPTPPWQPMHAVVSSTVAGRSAPPRSSMKPCISQPDPVPTPRSTSASTTLSLSGLFRFSRSSAWAAISRSP